MNKLRIAFAIVILIIWAAGYTLAFFDRTFTPAPELSGIMLATITWLFGAEIRKKITGDREEDK